MELSCKDIYSNPTGRWKTTATTRYSVRDRMNKVFIQNLQKNRGRFLAQPYQSDDGTVIMRVKVPSKNYNINRIIYDVVIEIEAGIGDAAVRPAKFFVNSPSFIYSYAYVFNKNKLLVPWLAIQIPQRALTQPPEVRNPNEELGYELILFEALCYIINGGCLTEQYLDKYSKKFDAYAKLEIQSKVSNPEKLTRIYHDAISLHAKTHKKDYDPKVKPQQRASIKELARTEKYRSPIKFRDKFMRRTPKAKLTAKSYKRKITSTTKSDF